MQVTWLWFLSQEDPLEKSESCSAMSNPGYPRHGILQARILEWVAISSSRESSQPRDRTHVSSIAGGFFTVWATREAPRKGSVKSNSETW